MIFLTPIGSDNFTRANENPLSQGGNWTDVPAGNASLQIVGDLCEGTSTTLNNGELYSGVSLPNNQYASVTYAASPASGAYLTQFIRLTDNGSFLGSEPAYNLYVYEGTWYVYIKNTTLIMDGGPITISAGDVFTLAAIGTTLYAYQNSTLLGSATNATYSSGIAALGINDVSSNLTTAQASNWVVGSASLTGTYSISGNAGVASATVSYSGTAVGSTTCDGSGNYSISGLAAGSYTITPSLAGYTFSPTSRNETIVSSNITSVNFVATASPSPSGAWSPVDSRVNKPNSATFRTVQGAQICDVQTSSNPAVPGVDSRAAGKPKDCRVAPNIPENSRTFPPFED
jgi:hypothetical protein